jgi:hypothetical protein
MKGGDPLNLSNGINRRELIKRSALIAGGLAIAGPGVLLQTACGSTKQLVKC